MLGFVAGDKHPLFLQLELSLHVIIYITREVLAVEIGARSLVEILPVVRIKLDYDNLYW